MENKKTFEEIFPTLNKYGTRFLCSDKRCVGDHFCEQYRIVDIMENCLDKTFVKRAINKLIKECAESSKNGFDSYACAKDYLESLEEDLNLED